MSVLFWNIHGLGILSNAEDNGQELSNRQTVLALSVTWSTAESIKPPANWSSGTCIVSPALKERNTGRASGGLAVMFNSNFATEIIDKSTHWLFIKITIRDFCFILETLYFKPSFDIVVLFEML